MLLALQCMPTCAQLSKLAQDGVMAMNIPTTGFPLMQSGTSLKEIRGLKANRIEQSSIQLPASRG